MKAALRHLQPALRRVYGLTLDDFVDMPVIDRMGYLDDLAMREVR